MYNVIIADDESAIRKGIMMLIDWEQYGFRIVGDAANGAEALHIVDRSPVDLIVTDIRMPVLDGLRLAEELRNRNLKRHIRVVLISAYKDFEYARKAIQYGVKEYILKPISEQKLIATLCGIRKELEDEDNYFNSMAHSVVSSQRAVFSDFNIDCNSGFLLKKALLYENGRSDVAFSVCIVSQKERRELGPEIAAGIQKMLKEYEWGYLDVGEKTAIILFCMSDASVSELKYMCQCIDHYVNAGVYSDFLLSAGGIVHHSSDIHLSYKQAKEQLGKKWPSDKSGIVLCDEENSSSITDPQPILERIEGVIRDRDAERMGDIINELLVSRQPVSGSTAWLNELCLQFFSLCIRILQTEGIDAGDIFNAELLRRLTAANHADGYERILTETCRRVIHALDTQSGGNNTAVISQIKNYIYRSCADDITLKDIAKSFSYNTEYLGRLFRRVSGMKFNDYLNYCRIEKAERMLAKGDRIVYEVSSAVGYRDINYFYRMFKRFKGYTPGDSKNKRADGSSAG